MGLWLEITFIYFLMTCFDIWREGKYYTNARAPDGPVPPHFPILRCDHDEEAHIKQSRQPSTTARAFYCCPYKSVSNSSHWWMLFDWTLTSFYSYESKIGADSFSGSMDSRLWIHKFFFSHMIGVSLVHCTLSSIGFLRHRIPLQWQMRRRSEKQPIVSATHLHANVVTVRSWWTCLWNWITHPSSVVRFLYR
jgi:hypothetical protein